jgi:pimeloyl-ACP methyl ester carboxylesterase
MRPDLQAQYLMWAWHFVRDTFVFWPWYRTDAAHRRPTGLPPAEALHEKLVELLKAITTYHRSYRAAIANDKRARFPLIRVPTLAACARTDMLAGMFEEFCALIPHAERALTPGIGTPEALAETVAVFARFLDSAERG